MTYDAEGGGGVTHININTSYDTMKDCELVLDKYVQAYAKLSDSRFINIEIAESSCVNFDK